MGNILPAVIVGDTSISQIGELTPILGMVYQGPSACPVYQCSNLNKTIYRGRQLETYGSHTKGRTPATRDEIVVFMRGLETILTLRRPNSWFNDIIDGLPFEVDWYE